jgi:hypothetical protein
MVPVVMVITVLRVQVQQLKHQLVLVIMLELASHQKLVVLQEVTKVQQVKAHA